MQSYNARRVSESARYIADSKRTIRLEQKRLVALSHPAMRKLVDESASFAWNTVVNVVDKQLRIDERYWHSDTEECGTHITALNATDVDSQSYKLEQIVERKIAGMRGWKVRYEIVAYSAISEEDMQTLRDLGKLVKQTSTQTYETMVCSR
jgi:hypothetical protein